MDNKVKSKTIEQEPSKGELIIYTSDDGTVSLEAKLEDETIWLTQDMIVKLFESSKANISEHISNIYKEKELDENSTVRKFRTVRKEGSRTVSRELDYYNLDLILSVGYRVKSKTAVRFRQWANKILKEYLVNGYSINEKLVQTQKEKILQLQTSIDLLARTIKNQAETMEHVKDVLEVLNNFSKGLTLLDDYDHKELCGKGLTIKPSVVISQQEYLKIINAMKSKYANDVFANPKDGSFASSINQIYQTFGAEDCYPSIEEKAAMLLYLITKNHSFSDGNKRIAASCFLYYLERNGILYKNKVPVIDNGTLFTLTLLIAESKPEEMELMKKIVISILNTAVETGGGHG